jgi:hypothetical protein
VVGAVSIAVSRWGATISAPEQNEDYAMAGSPVYSRVRVR